MWRHWLTCVCAVTSPKERNTQTLKECKGLLALIGIDASIEAIRGCSEHDGACLLARVATLVTAVSAHAQDPAKAAASAAAAHRLLDAACANPGRFCSDAAQLLPRDMAVAVAAYGCARVFAALVFVWPAAACCLLPAADVLNLFLCRSGLCLKWNILHLPH